AADDDEQATADLREALDVLADSGAELEHARCLVALGERADDEDALREGLDLAWRCGADALAAQAREALRARGRRPRTPARRGAHALTPSETRIALMAAAGETNAAIAQALFVTPKTVESHLTSAYRKLGIDGRQGLPDALDER